MKITTKLVLSIETGETLVHEWYDYEGPVDYCCFGGGDALSDQKKQAAQQQQQLAAQQAALANKAAGIQMPFLENEIQNGLPFMPQLEDYSSGTLAKSFAPAKAAMNRNLAGFGDTLPDGMKQQLQNNFNEGEGQAFDQNQTSNLLLNQQAKNQAAGMLDPSKYFSGAGASSGSVLNAPPIQSQNWGNFLGGAASGLFNAAGTAGGFGALL